MNFDPFAQMTKVFEVWQKMADDSVQRAVGFYAELDKLESKGIERAAVAVDEMAVLQKETLSYGAQLASEMRRLTIESMKQASSSFAAAQQGNKAA